MFSGAERLRFLGFELVILKSTRPYRGDLAACREELLRLATFARGWGPEEVPRMREVFKVEPFYMATSLVLVFDRDRLCGTAGVDTDFQGGPIGPNIIHLCSVNLLDPLKHSGLAALLLVLLADHLISPLPREEAVYFTSISQSPLVYRLLARLADIHPNGRESAPPDVQDVARTVVAKYDPHISLEGDNLILRKECAFFYKRLPYVADPRVNHLFDSRLDIQRGDVFVNVGKSDVATAVSVIERYRRRVAAMMESG